MKIIPLVFFSFFTNTIKLSFLLCITVSVSACKLIPSFSDDTAEDHYQNVAANIDYYDTNQTHTDEINNTNVEVMALKEEFATLKPSILKLIELESDLAALITTVKQVNIDSEIFANGNINESRHIDTEALLEADNFVVGSPKLGALFFENKFSLSHVDEIQQGKVDNIAVESAPPLIKTTDYNAHNKIQRQKILENVPTHKFNNSTEPLIFSQSSRLQQCQTVAIGEGFAMHIASFKNKESAETMLIDTIEKINNNTDCSRDALIENVSVNGQSFYSARIGSYLSKADATLACSQIKHLLSYCGVTKNVGNLL